MMITNLQQNKPMNYNIESLTKKPVFILVKSDGCFHCNMMKEEWDTTKKIIMKDNNNNYSVVEIEQKAFPTLIKRHNIFRDIYKRTHGFPTIMMKNGRQYHDYNGIRKSQNFMRFLNLHLRSPYAPKQQKIDK